jgi:serine/threonine-protein kinase
VETSGSAIIGSLSHKMSLAPGVRLGPYEILSAIGAGGMGEVYKARDTRLERTVAIKILPTSDPVRRQRFEREARAVAALNHPNICTLHDVGQQDGTDFLVMEYLEGQTLADRLKKSALPLDQALQCAIQIAEALDRAHKHGIVHRDLKPGNIMLTNGGAKLLDFGIATIRPTEVRDGVATTRTDRTLTAEGNLIGTLHYMAPEQLEGREADTRSDLFAFGAVFYEMLTGRRPFEGETESRVIAAVLDSEPPPISGTQPLTPSVLEHVVKRCLAKDPEERWQTMHDVGLQVKWIAESAATVPSVQQDRRRLSKRPWMVGLAAAGLILATVATGSVLSRAGRRLEERSPEVTRSLVSVAPADQVQDYVGRGNRPVRRALTLSPNGRHLVFSALQNGRLQLYARSLGLLEARPIPGTEGAASPFFSPDGEWVGFWTSTGELRKVPIDGGPSVTLCRVQGFHGASWGSDGRIVFALQTGGLWEVSDAGGSPEPLTMIETTGGEVSHRLPHVIQGGDAVLFTVTRNRFPNWGETDVFIYLRQKRTQKLLFEGGADARYTSSGHVVYVREGVLMAAPFDTARMEVTGGSVALVADVMQAVYESPARLANTGAAQFAISDSGALAYIPGGVAPETQRVLSWVDRTGRVEPLRVSPRSFTQPRLSPDDQRIAVATSGRKTDIYVFEIARGNVTRLTTEGRNGTPIWSPDGTRLTYRSSRSGADNLFWLPADGNGAPERLTTSIHNQVPATWAPDGQGLLFYDLRQHSKGLRSDIWLLPLQGDRKPRSILESPFFKFGVDVSPNGQWLAYASNESDRPEVYIRPYDRPGPRVKVSVEGGMLPVWRRDGRELFFIVPPTTQGQIQMMAAPVTTRPALSTGTPSRLFEGSYFTVQPGRSFDVTADGQRFLMVQEMEPPSVKITQMVLVQNWFEELKRRVPGK